MDEKNNIVSQIGKNQNVVIAYSSQDYLKQIMELYKSVFNKFKDICIITVAKPYTDLIKKFQKQGIDITNCLFVDCISKENKKTEHSEQCIYLPSPTALTQLALTISEVRKKSIDLIILDNISSLLIYNKDVTVLKFLNSVIANSKGANTQEIYIILQKDMKKSMADLSLFADKVIEKSSQNKTLGDKVENGSDK